MADHGSAPPPAMLRCPVGAGHLFPTMAQALRDMRAAHHRVPETGEGDATGSPVGLALGMIVLDTLSGCAPDVRRRWVQLLTANDISEPDAVVIAATRDAVLHGYGPPTNPEKTGGRIVVFTDDPHAYAVDTSRPGVAEISIPVFCGRLVERIAAAMPGSWDVSEVDPALAGPVVTAGRGPEPAGRGPEPAPVERLDPPGRRASAELPAAPGWPASAEEPAAPEHEPLDLDGLDLDELAMALQDQQNYEHGWLIDPATGKIAYWTRDCGIDGEHPVDLDELDLVCIDPLPSSVWYRDMEDFAERLSDERAGRRLLRAIQGRGAFRHFKAELHDEYPHLVQTWYAFRDTRAQRRAVEWLAGNELVTEQAAERFCAEHPDPELP